MNSESNSTKSIDAYFDNLSYTGLQPPLQVLGDFNNDNKVDGSDYVIWRKNETANVSLPNDNGLTTQADRYALWRANFGSSGGVNALAAGSTSGNDELNRAGLMDWQANSPTSPPETAASLVMAKSTTDNSDKPAPRDNGPTPLTGNLPVSFSKIATLHRKTDSMEDVSSFASRRRKEHLTPLPTKPKLAAKGDTFQQDVHNAIDVRFAENDEAVQCAVFEGLDKAIDEIVGAWRRQFHRHL